MITFRFNVSFILRTSRCEFNLLLYNDPKQVMDNLDIPSYSVSYHVLFYNE